MNNLHDYSIAHRYLLETVARHAKLHDPVAFTAGILEWPLLQASRKGEAIPLDGALVYDWNPDNRKVYAGLQLGARLYTIDGIRFVVVQFDYDFNILNSGLRFIAVERRDYLRLYRTARRHQRKCEPPTPPPILPQEQVETLWNNTIRYLESENLERIRAYGGRARRGLLLTGPPGNGKTMACRWIWDECRQRNWEYRIITPNCYRQARHSCNAEEAVRALFSVQRRGVIFFDDMDLALRDRNAVDDIDDQAIFLTALDGIGIKEGIVYVFTTNCELKRIDRAFKRPGRIDVVMEFRYPDASLRRKLIQRWHPDILACICVDRATDETRGYSFAEIDELKNLLIMHFIDANSWDWRRAIDQFQSNREEFQSRIRRQVGFSLSDQPVNGHHED